MDKNKIQEDFDNCKTVNDVATLYDSYDAVLKEIMEARLKKMIALGVLTK